MSRQHGTVSRYERSEQRNRRTTLTQSTCAQGRGRHSSCEGPVTSSPVGRAVSAAQRRPRSPRPPASRAQPRAVREQCTRLCARNTPFKELHQTRNLTSYNCRNSYETFHPSPPQPFKYGKTILSFPADKTARGEGAGLAQGQVACAGGGDSAGEGG